MSLPSWRCPLASDRPAIVIRDGRAEDRPAIYRVRHQVFATELAQHPENSSGQLSDPLDAYNRYVVASCGDELCGFVSVTPPGPSGYAFEKYWPRDQIPFHLDDRLYEIRLLVVCEPWRRYRLSYLLLYGAWMIVATAGAERVAVTGHGQITDFYLALGMRRTGLTAPAGAMPFELLTSPTAPFHAKRRELMPTLRQIAKAAGVVWELELPFEAELG